jgi:hypothetical protein
VACSRVEAEKNLYVLATEGKTKNAFYAAAVRYGFYSLEVSFNSMNHDQNESDTEVTSILEECIEDTEYDWRRQ